MNKILLDIVGMAAQAGNSYALILSEHSGGRRLPIVIGQFEAQAIAFELENFKRQRPMTHDLIKNLIQEFDGYVREIIISDIKDGIFYAKIVIETPSKEIILDSRPSDAIAIAVRFRAPIYTVGKVLEVAGIALRIEDEEIEAMQKDLENQRKQNIEKEKLKVDIKSKIEDLYRQIQNAINEEDYEKAARLRDEIRKLEK